MPWLSQWEQPLVYERGVPVFIDTDKPGEKVFCSDMMFDATVNPDMTPGIWVRRSLRKPLRGILR